MTGLWGLQLVLTTQAFLVMHQLCIAVSEGRVRTKFVVAEWAGARTWRDSVMEKKLSMAESSLCS